MNWRLVQGDHVFARWCWERLQPPATPHRISGGKLMDGWNSVKCLQQVEEKWKGPCVGHKHLIWASKALKTALLLPFKWRFITATGCYDDNKMQFKLNRPAHGCSQGFWTQSNIFCEGKSKAVCDRTLHKCINLRNKNKKEIQQICIHFRFLLLFFFDNWGPGGM